MADCDMRRARLDPTHASPPIDTTVPSVARVHDAILGGEDNFAVDRVVAEEAMRAMSDGGNGARLNRAALGRAVRYMADRGVTQFLDLGSGLPTARNTHQIAQGVNPDARVVYVDNDPSVSVHGHALLTGDDSTVVVLADVRSPDRLLALPSIASFFDGLELVPPGLVFLPWWRPDGQVDRPPPVGSLLMLVGVGRKP
jgi:S-adenosyl methyltransferase